MGVITGGAAFNGGTITQPLEVAPASGVSPMLAVDNGQASFDFGNAGDLTVDSPFGTHTSIRLVESGLGTDHSRVESYGLIFGRGDSSEVNISNSAGTVNYFDVFSTLFGFTQNAAPADGDFGNNGMCALWLDATPGASVLHIKALDSGGTPVVPAIAASGGRLNPITSGALPTTTFVSGTGKQILTTRDVFLVVPCTLNPTAGAAGTVAVALSPDNTTYSTLVTITEPAGVALDGTVIPASLQVPAGWYVKLTATNATIGTGTYY